MTHPYEATLPRLRREHDMTVDNNNHWACTCGAEGKTRWNTTRAVAQASGQRHVRAAHRRIIREIGGKS